MRIKIIQIPVNVPILVFISLLAFFPSAHADGCSAQNYPKNICYDVEVGPLYDKRAALQDYWKYVSRLAAPKCRPMPDRYLRVFKRIFPLLPEVPRKLLCSVRHIVITPLEPAGVADKVWDVDHREYVDYGGKKVLKLKQKGVALLIAEDVLDEMETSSNAETRRARGYLKTLFGTPNTAGTFKYEMGDENSGDARLVDTLVHESGHVLDFYNALTRSENSSWTALSWIWEKESGAYVLKDGNTLSKEIFSNRLTTVSFAEFIDLFIKSGFFTFYSAANPSEDFAEHFELYFQRKAEWFYAGKKIDIKEQPLIHEKLEFIDQLLKAPDTSYTYKDIGDYLLWL